MPTHVATCDECGEETLNVLDPHTCPACWTDETWWELAAICRLPESKRPLWPPVLDALVASMFGLEELAV
jgi:hypothetical protein